LKLRFQLLQGLPGSLPWECRLPEGYSLEFHSGRQFCQDCGGTLQRVRSSIRQPVGLMLGRPHVRLIEQQCTRCRQADSLDAYFQEVPPRGNYAFDLMVEVGLARHVKHQQDEEIRKQLQQRWGLDLPASSIGLLADSFLDGLAAVHQAHAPTLRRRLEEDGGYAMHVDGTCEAETDVLFAAIAEPHGWILEIAKMTSENKREIGKLMERCCERFGHPLAVVRDLSPNIAQAKAESIPQARDLICHYHFLETVGKKLCEKPHSKLKANIRRLKIASALKSIRHDLVHCSRKGDSLSATQIEQFLSHPEEIGKMDLVTSRRLVAYLTLRWLDDYKADLQGEYFPFDLPQLAFYRRGVKLAKMLREWVEDPGFPQRELSTFNTVSRHLGSLLDDEEVVMSAARTEKAEKMFTELRKVLRLSSRPSQTILRQRGPQEDRNAATQIQKRLEVWRDRLQKQHDQERDKERRADQAIVLQYLKKYETQLVGHVIELAGGRGPLVVRRTNNPAEHRFGSMKQGVRRKVGLKKLTRQIQAMRPEALLVRNLANQEYLNLVLDGTLENLPSAIAKQWGIAQAIRKSRKQATSDHPMPTTKKQLRNPLLLDNVKQLMAILVNMTSNKLQRA